jgi:hypothetical protein
MENDRQDDLAYGRNRQEYAVDDDYFLAHFPIT